jgi:hypothetical protein
MQIEKLCYMHRNPVKRGLVDNSEMWQRPAHSQRTRMSGAPAPGPNLPEHSAVWFRTAITVSLRYNPLRL